MYGRWVGSLDDVVLVLRNAIYLVAERGQDVETRITVEQPGLTLEYDDTEELKKHTTRADIAEVQVIGAHVYQEALPTEEMLSVSLSFYPSAFMSEAVSLRVSGPDRTLVEGLRAQIDESLQPGHRFPFVSGGAVATGMASLGAVIALGLSVTGLIYDWTPQSIKDGGAAPFVVVGVMALVIAAMSVPWALLFPRWEWLRSDGRTRWDRSRLKVWAAIGTLTLAVIAAVLIDLVL